MFNEKVWMRKSGEAEEWRLLPDFCLRRFGYVGGIA